MVKSEVKSGGLWPEASRHRAWQLPSPPLHGFLPSWAGSSMAGLLGDPLEPLS